MDAKSLLAHIFIKKGKAVNDLRGRRLFRDGNAVSLARHYEDKGADALIIFEVSQSEEDQEQNLNIIRGISKVTDFPLIAGGSIRTEEDVKKLLYAGCDKVFLDMSKESNINMLKDLSKRFGKEKIAVCTKDFTYMNLNNDTVKEYASEALLLGDNFHLYEAVRNLPLKAIPVMESVDFGRMYALLKEENVAGISGKLISDTNTNLYDLKISLMKRGLFVNGSSLPLEWKELKLNADGLIPVIVQDYKNSQVLMMAYMNEEAFQRTILTGRMTYWSRSRQELWLKGETSGHYQYLKHLSIDCDNDTLLARVSQVGAACHTGNRSCFYRDLVTKNIKEKSAATVLSDVYKIIEDRKENPKEGSYTSYLFDKGLDKILKKIGEEATEIVIAAKNPNSDEVVYEASDFLYHLMVLMVEKGVKWEDLAEELAKR